MLLLTFAVGDYAGEPVRQVLQGPGTVRITRLALDPDDPGRSRIGALRLLAAWELTSQARAFGSWSGLVVDQGWLTFLSDAGGVFRLRLAGVTPVAAEWRDLPDGPGPAFEKRFRDSEGLALDPASGRLWVSFEHRNSIFRFAPRFTRAEAAVFPPAMQDWPTNGGAEAIARLADGRFLVFEEGRRAPGPRAGLIFAGDPTDSRTPPPQRFAYVPAAGYRVTDAAELPDRRLLVLERRIAQPWTARLTVLERDSVRPGATVSGRLLAFFAPPVLHDNFEALAVSTEAGRTIIWLASDDNFSPLQRSLLLKLTFAERQKPAGETPTGF